MGLLCVGERSGFLELPASGDVHGCVNEVKDGNSNYAIEGQMKFNHLFGETVIPFLDTPPSREHPTCSPVWESEAVVGDLASLLLHGSIEQRWLP